MSEIQMKSKDRNGRMLFSVFFGASIGAVLGVIAYVNNWLG
ncbi:hypothetical protein ACIQZG_20525 [Lysinibacillus sp. NPDC096418]